MSMNMSDIIAELDRIDRLVTRLYEVSRAVDDIEDEKEKELKNIHKTMYPSLPRAPKLFQTLEEDPGVFIPANLTMLRISAIGFAGLVISWFVSWLVPSISAFSFRWIAFLAAIGFGIAFFMGYGRYKEDKADFEKREARRNAYKEMVRNGYSEDKANFAAALGDFYANYLLYDHKFDECFFAYEDRRTGLLEEGHTVIEQLDAVTLLAQEYISLAGRIRNMLTGGRADTLKEALNLAIAESKDEEFKAKQLAEEERRTRIAQQQAEETRLHMQQMEREAAAQTRQAQDQARIAAEQLKATEQQNAQLRQLLEQQKRR